MSSLYVPQPFGDAYDGSPNFDGSTVVLGITPSAGVYTLPNNIVCDVLTVRSGVRLAVGQFVIIARRIVVEANAFISANGNNAAGTTGGAAIVAGAYTGFVSGSGGNSVSRTTVGNSNGVAGGGSGGSSMGGTGGAAGYSGAATPGAGNTSVPPSLSLFKAWRTPGYALSDWRMPATGSNTSYSALNGGGGGGGGGVQLTVASGTEVLAGGGGGGGAGAVYFRCGVLDNLGTIEARGGSGANAVVGVGVSGFAGGGGGGSGGAIHGYIGQLYRAGTITVAGGAGGTGIGSPTRHNGVMGGPGTLCLFVNGEAV